MIATIAAMIRSRWDRSQRTNANVANATAPAHSAIVISPSVMEPPKASSRPLSSRPAKSVSIHSIAGTVTEANATVASTNRTPHDQLGGSGARTARRAATSQHSRNPRTAIKPAAAIATVTISSRDPWLPTSSNEAWGTK